MKRIILILAVLMAVLLLCAVLFQEACLGSGRDEVDRTDDTPAGGADAPGLAGRGQHDKRAADSVATSASESSAPRPGASPWMLTGRVLDGEGRSVPGADVDAHVRRGTLVTHLPSVRADETGVYRVDVRVLADGPKLIRATSILRLHARADGFQPGAWSSIELAEHEPGTQLERDLQLLPGCTATGRIVDAGGTPLADVGVHLRRADSRGIVSQASTAADGRYTLGTVVSRAYFVYAHGPAGYGQSEHFTLAERESVEVPDLVLRAAGIATGIVVHADGSPVPGAAILMARAEPKGMPLMSAAVTDEDGHFEVAVPDEHGYVLEVGDTLGEDARAACKAGDRDVRLTVTGARLVVRVVDPAGRPLPGATITHMGWPKKRAAVLDALMAGTTTSAKAREHAYASSAGEVRYASGIDTTFVEAESAWHVAAYVTGGVPAETAVRFAPDQTLADVTLVVRADVPTGRLDLVLLAPAGTPIRKFAVAVESLSGATLASLRKEEGGVLPPVPAGRVRLRISPEAGASWLEQQYHVGTFLLPIERIVEIPEGGTRPLQLRAKEGGRFRMQLEYPEGEEPERDRLRIQVKPRDDPEAAARYVGMWMKGAGAEMIVTSTFHSDGACVNVHLLEAGDYLLTVVTDGHGTHERNLRIQPGEIADVVIDLTR